MDMGVPLETYHVALRYTFTLLCELVDSSRDEQLIITFLVCFRQSHFWVILFLTKTSRFLFLYRDRLTTKTWPLLDKSSSFFSFYSFPFSRDFLFSIVQVTAICFQFFTIPTIVLGWVRGIRRIFNYASIVLISFGPVSSAVSSITFSLVISVSLSDLAKFIREFVSFIVRLSRVRHCKSRILATAVFLRASFST